MNSKMIEKLFDEIDIALENNCLLSALIMSLMLPDICGKAAYPDSIKSEERYVNWIKDRQNENIKKNNAYDLFLDGKLIYKRSL